LKKSWKRFKQSTFFVKLMSWEYWPAYITNIPVVGFWLFFAIRSRALFFFSAVNPVIETGGVLGESKINILNRLPKATIPKTIYIKKGTIDVELILEQMKFNDLFFPIIAKPDIGERGFLVERISNNSELTIYLQLIKVDFIIQEFIDFQEEISVMYHRIPDKQNGKITSVCVKKNLAVVGNGHSTVEELMQEYSRARIQLSRFRKNNASILKTIPKRGALLELEPIGNHNRGTTFLNGNHLIDKNLEDVFDEIAVGIEGIYYGRFDLKCKSMELLKEGRGFKILEFNGVASEPAHIYDPEYSTLQGYKDIYDHWKIIYKISEIQREKGIESMTTKEAYNSVSDYLKYMRSAKV